MKHVSINQFALKYRIKNSCGREDQKMLKVEDGPVKTLGTQREKGKRSVLFALTAQCQAYNLAHSWWSISIANLLMNGLMRRERLKKIFFFWIFSHLPPLHIPLRTKAQLWKHQLRGKPLYEYLIVAGEVTVRSPHPVIRVRENSQVFQSPWNLDKVIESSPGSASN